MGRSSCSSNSRCWISVWTHTTLNGAWFALNSDENWITFYTWETNFKKRHWLSIRQFLGVLHLQPTHMKKTVFIWHLSIKTQSLYAFLLFHHLCMADGYMLMLKYWNCDWNVSIHEMLCFHCNSLERKNVRIKRMKLCMKAHIRNFSELKHLTIFWKKAFLETVLL